MGRSSFTVRTLADAVTGTLGDCTPALRMWCLQMNAAVQRKCVDTGISTTQAEHIVSKFHESIGWNAVISDVVSSAPLSAGTWEMRESDPSAKF
jgi:hypothetical protein